MGAFPTWIYLACAGMGLGVGFFILSQLRMKGYLWFVGLMVTTAVGAYIPFLYETVETNPFRSHVEEYRTIIFSSEVKEAVNSQPYIRGKLLILTRRLPGKYDVVPIYLALDDNIIPSTPGEVGTVAAIDCDWTEVGHYGPGGGSARQQACEIKIIDLATKYAAFGRIEGGDPAKQASRRSGASGSNAGSEIIRWLNHLPRK